VTPAARVAAAIEILDLILDGSSPEKALTGWGRSHRFAGSKDRAAIRGAELADAPRDVALDMPDWLLAHFDGALGADADAVLSLFQQRAGVFLRVNTAKGSREDAVVALAEDGIEAVALDHVKSDLQVTVNARKVALSNAYLNGLVELQDPSSQAAIEALNLTSGMTVLDRVPSHSPACTG